MSADRIPIMRSRSVRRPLAACCFLTPLVLLGCSTAEDTGPRQVASAEDAEWIVERGEAMMETIGDAIGNFTDVRFLRSGEFVVVLDQHTPHLRLFRRDGTPLWQGGPAGEGPGELRFPRAMTTDEGSVWVWEFGRVSRWQLDGDSLAGSLLHSGGTTMPALAITLDCDGELLIYGMRLEAATTFTGGPGIGLVHRLSGMDEGTIHVSTLWSAVRDGGVPYSQSRSAAILNADDSGWVVQHRKGFMGSDRDLLVFDCEGSVTGTFPETALAEGREPTMEQFGTGAVMASGGAPQGVAKWRGGFLLMTLRRDGAARETRLIMHAGDNDFRWVQMPNLRRPWFLQDADPEGGLIIAQRDPTPHFIPVAPHEIEDLFQLDPGEWTRPTRVGGAR